MMFRSGLLFAMALCTGGIVGGWVMSEHDSVIHGLRRSDAKGTGRRDELLPSPARTDIGSLISRKFDAERQDASWAGNATHQLLASLKMTHGTIVEKAECKTTICRIDLKFEDLTDEVAFQRDNGPPTARPWNGDAFFVSSPGAQGWPRHDVLFIGREKASLLAQPAPN